MGMEEKKEPYRRVIIVLSIAIPLVVGGLFRVKIKGYDLTFLPPIYALINGVTAMLLLTSWWAIRNDRRSLHEKLNKVCIGLSATFLIMYVLYHMTSESTPYGGTGTMKWIYYAILLSHISLSVVIVPIVLFTFSRALAGNFERHRRLAKFAMPLWLYVAITGVLVYLMISPYYNH